MWSVQVFDNLGDVDLNVVIKIELNYKLGQEFFIGVIVICVIVIDQVGNEVMCIFEVEVIGNI